MGAQVAPSMFALCWGPGADGAAVRVKSVFLWGRETVNK